MQANLYEKNAPCNIPKDSSENSHSDNRLNRFWKRISYDPFLDEACRTNPEASLPSYKEHYKDGYAFDPRVKEDYIAKHAGQIFLKPNDFDVDENWEAEMPCRSLFLEDLPEGLNPSSLACLFEEFGAIEHVELVRDRNGRYSSQGSLTFETWRSAKWAFWSFSASSGIKVTFDRDGSLLQQAKNRVLSYSSEALKNQEKKNPIQLQALPRSTSALANDFSVSSIYPETSDFYSATIGFKYIPNYSNAQDVLNLFKNYHPSRISCCSQHWLVEFPKKDDLKRSLVCLNGRIFQGRKIQIEEQKSSIPIRQTEGSQGQLSLMLGSAANFVVSELISSVLSLVSHRFLGDLVHSRLQARLKERKIIPSYHELLKSASGTLDSSDLPRFRKKFSLSSSLSDASGNAGDADFSRCLSKKSKMSSADDAENQQNSESSCLLEKSKPSCARIRGFIRKSFEKLRPSAILAPQKGQTRRSSRQDRAANRQLIAGLGSAGGDIFKINALSLRKKQLKVQRSSIHSWGLFSLENIDQNDVVVEYVGEKVRIKVAEKREKEYALRGIGSSYLFRLDEEYVLDSTRMGNAARFINHSCDPNLNAKIITLDGQKRIVFFARRYIQEGEEVTYDYKFPKEGKKIPCFCGTADCRKYLN